MPQKQSAELNDKELAELLAKLPESVKLRLLYMIEGAKLVSDVERSA